MATSVLQRRSLYPQVIPPVEPYNVYPLEMIRPRYMPAADMRSVLNQYHHRPSYAEQSLPNISVAKSSFVRHTPQRLSTSKRPRTFAARTCVPENVYTPDYAERLLPRAPRIKTDTLPNGGPYSFLARKRKLLKPKDNGILYTFLPSPEPLSEQGSQSERGTPRDICSVIGRPYSRKRWINGPRDNLIVASFDGGAAEPTPNERRFLQLMLGTTLVI